MAGPNADLKKKLQILGGLSALLLIGMAAAFGPELLPRGDVSPLPPIPFDVAKLAEPAALARWPWPGAARANPHSGVTHWMARSADGTLCDLLEFDFTANPRLRFELYSQDEDDAKPFDNIVQFWPLGVGPAVRHLNDRFAVSRGRVIAAWNGPFFGYYRNGRPIQQETGFHVAPVVLRGKVYYNKTNHRWTFGVKYQGGRPVFKMLHLPGRAAMEKEFDFAAGSVQYVVRNGQPMKLEPFPKNSHDFRKQPVPSTPQEAGHVPDFDHAKFSRASVAWSRDNRRLYVLLVRESNGDNEGHSIHMLRRGGPQSNGFNLYDLQRFWLALAKAGPAPAGKVWNAMNSDAGDVGQLAYRLRNGRYMMVTPRGDNPPTERREFTPAFKDAPQGGAVMYFYVRE